MTGVSPSTNVWLGVIALVGFILVATAQASNQILARGLAGSVPPFALAFFRWSIVAIGLAPIALKEILDGRVPLAGNIWSILAAGFMGMFLCGGPVYAAGVSTTAIHIALIMALSPITVLLISALRGMEHVGPLQWLGTALALAGALLIISGGHPQTLIELQTAAGDGLVVIAMLGWSGYTLLQSRAAPKASLLARISLFSGAGALFSLPLAAMEMWATPGVVFSTKALSAYVFAGIVPGLLAYAGFAWLGGKFGSVRTSLVLYLGPIASALLSFAILGEPPQLIHLLGGLLILGGVWASLRR
ncbi:MULTISPECIES: DMT family transporter [Bradyrhizobium]|uniref:DMT family transporter n=1 Tax=Bradyrhizobium TaxID=374 RepID=UPI00067426D9|nr:MULTISPECIES: DMT family transporter [unclassified Bradyrhizobium]MDA9487214.1 membrane protein [Bradyrhizobium sp. CCBAU 11445]PDT67351.1 EamA/RhaT family transporter [Bradyrhizobium ottawaense]MDA9450835.1 membrane protein [Bradyrhizobium sp. CCBAU 21360]MDA9458588.1 membrane protein [Bradyrhizobium sp. CCBAU 21359]MDA9517858.1 membrane protein [Bradyrhizobium sp. CCBAU 11430]